MTIHEAIPKIMSEIGVVGKDKTSQQGYKYRGIDAVMNALQPALTKNGVFVVPEVLEQAREDRQTTKGGNLIYSVCKIKYTFYASDGSSIAAIVIGEGMDSGDKATNKAMAIAFKYACFQVFCIPTEEMKDPDSESHEVVPIDRGSLIPPPPAARSATSCGQCGREIKGIRSGEKVISATEIIKLSKGLPAPLCYKCLKESENG